VQREAEEEGHEKAGCGGCPEDVSAGGGGCLFRRGVPGEELGSGGLCRLRGRRWEVEGVAGFHEEAEESVGVGVVCDGGEVRAGGGECEQAEEAGVSDGGLACVGEDEDVRDEVSAEGAVVLQPGGQVGERVRGVEREAGLGEKVAQLGDVCGEAGGELFEL
jgi:hypothetical protein